MRNEKCCGDEYEAVTGGCIPCMELYGHFDDEGMLLDFPAYDVEVAHAS